MNIRTIKKNQNKTEKKIDRALYSTLIGSIVTSVGIVNGKTRSDMNKLFNALKAKRKTLPTTIEELVEFVIKQFDPDGNRLKYANLVLIYDNRQIFTPLVTLTTSEGDLLPLAKDGMYYGILGYAKEGRDFIGYEYIFDEKGEHYDDE